MSPQWKGKQRAVEGSGGQAGVVLALNQVGSTVYDISYSVPILIGSQNVSLQVDTGSSDMWVASTSCSSSSCSGEPGQLYNPSSAKQTGETLTMDYLVGSVSGPIVWDQVTLGGYEITNQALAAANHVGSETLSSNFDGILGLALPLNSVIASHIPTSISSDEDGAAFASNLFSTTPSSTAPSSPFISLSLSRPGSNEIPALLSIGRHPSQFVQDPSTVSYTTLVGSTNGILFWRVAISAVTVYANGQALPVSLGSSSGAGPYPTAVLDSGVPIILTTTQIANAIYGAIGVSPASDGNYYLPCDTPLNMTITIQGLPPIPIHPLDLTSQPPSDPSSNTCVGLIQTSANSQLSDPSSPIGNMVLGVPFLRNVYTVMAYEPPNSNGTFSAVGSAGTATGSTSNEIAPMVGLVPLTNATLAMEEFYRVRVLDEPLDPGYSDPSGNNSTSSGMSIGLQILIGIIGFLAFCILVFVAWWYIGRRRWRAGEMRRPSSMITPALGSAWIAALDKDRGAYELARRQGSDEETLRALRYEKWKERESVMSGTAGSDRTMGTPTTDSFARGEMAKDASDDGHSYSGHDRILSPLSSTFPHRSPLSHARSVSNASDMSDSQIAASTPLLSLEPTIGVGHGTQDGSIDAELRPPPAAAQSEFGHGRSPLAISRSSSHRSFASMR